MAKEKKILKEDKKEDSSEKKTKAKVNSGKKGKSGKDDLKEITEQLASEKDRVLRLSAEFENYKKRTQRELDEFKKFANESVFRQILSVVDNLERAIDAAKAPLDKDPSDKDSSGKDASGDNALLEGVKLTYKEMGKLLETFNVKVVDAENQPFDPKFHQAVNQQETDEVPENTVTAVLQKGYILHDRLIRPAMVIVSKKPAIKSEEIEAEEAKEN